jgi:hypothetical protein
MDVGADAAHALDEGDALQIIAALGEVLDAAEIEANIHDGVGDGFAVADQLEFVWLFECGVVGSDGDAKAHLVASLCRLMPSGSPARVISGAVLFRAGKVDGEILVCLALNPVGRGAEIGDGGNLSGLLWRRQS